MLGVSMEPVAFAVLEADYLVVGAGAVGLAFTDALVNYADVNVVLVDRRHGVGGHWLNAYPFVRLHQASSFYGVASTRLGEDRLQENGPEAGMHERATYALNGQGWKSRADSLGAWRQGKRQTWPSCGTG